MDFNREVWRNCTVEIQWRDVVEVHHFYSVLLLRELLRLRFFTLLQRLLVLSLLFGHQRLVMLNGAVLLL